MTKSPKMDLCLTSSDDSTIEEDLVSASSEYDGTILCICNICVESHDDTCDFHMILL